MNSRLFYPAISAAALHLGFLFAFESNGEARGPHRPVDDTLILDGTPPEFTVVLTPPDVVDFDPSESDDAPPATEPVPVGPPQPHTTGSAAEIGPIPTETDQGGIVIEGGWTKPDPRAWGDGVSSHYGSPTLDIGHLDQPPRATFQASPHYPLELRRDGIEGMVQITFVVGRDGRVVHATVIESTHPEFAKAAERAVRKWRFEPGKSRGASVQFRMTVPIIFSVTS